MLVDGKTKATIEGPAQVTENDPFELRYKLHNTDSNGKAVYSVDTSAITITASSGGKTINLPFEVGSQTQDEIGLIIVLLLVAIKPSPDPRVAIEVKMPTTWQTDVGGERRSGHGDNNATMVFARHAQVVERKTVLVIKERRMAQKFTPSPRGPVVEEKEDPGIAKEAAVCKSLREDFVRLRQDLNESRTLQVTIGGTTKADDVYESLREDLAHLRQELNQSLREADRTFVVTIGLFATGLFVTQVVMALLVVGCVNRTLKTKQKREAAQSSQLRLEYLLSSRA